MSLKDGQGVTSVTVTEKVDEDLENTESKENDA